MEISINYLAVLVCAVLSMVVGGVWYGPLFGKKWMEVIGINPSDMDDPIKKKEMQKGMGSLYFTQFILSLFQIYVLAHYIAGWVDASGVENSLWIWAAFIIPTLAGSSMWTNDKSKIKWQRFLIQAGYNLVMFVIYGCIISLWK